MKAISEFKAIYLHRDPVDMRKGVNGLTEIVEQAQMGDLMGPHLFVFCSRRREVLKILYFDRSGFALWYKRLEEARFAWPRKLEQAVVTLSAEQLQWLLSGLDVWKMKPFSELRYEKFS